MARKTSKTAITLYFFLVFLLLVLLLLSVFRIVQMDTGFFTRYVVALLFVLLLLPSVPKIKIFDIVDIKRETRFLKR